MRTPYKILGGGARIYLFFKRCERHPQYRSDSEVKCAACVREEVRREEAAARAQWRRWERQVRRGKVPTVTFGGDSGEG